MNSLKCCLAQKVSDKILAWALVWWTACLQFPALQPACQCSQINRTPFQGPLHIACKPAIIVCKFCKLHNSLWDSRQTVNIKEQPFVNSGSDATRHGINIEPLLVLQSVRRGATFMQLRIDVMSNSGNDGQWYAQTVKHQGLGFFFVCFGFRYSCVDATGFKSLIHL